MASGGGEWHSFQYKSDSGRYIGSVQVPVIYKHWLPNDVTELLPEKLQSTDVNELDFYEEFNTLIHTTTFENASAIFRSGFKCSPVSDSSVVKPTYSLMNWDNQTFSRPRHPLSYAKILWYGPCTFQQLEDPTFVTKRYGNVVFSMKSMEGYEGIIRLSGGMKLYLIEVIEYQKSTACRMLATNKIYPNLREFDPYTLGGPLYINKSENKFYYTSKLKKHDGVIAENILEIMQEESTDIHVTKWRLENHNVSFCFFEGEKSGIFVVSRPRKEDRLMSELLQNILKLAIILSTYKKKKPPFELRTPFTSEQDRDENLRMELDKVHLEIAKKHEMHVKEMPSTEDLIGEAIENMVYQDATVELRDLYLQMLVLIPKERHPSLTKTLFEKIRKILKRI